MGAKLVHSMALLVVLSVERGVSAQSAQPVDPHAAPPPPPPPPAAPPPEPVTPPPPALSPAEPMFSPRPSGGPTTSSVSLATSPPTLPVPPPTPPSPYALPFQLRSVSPRNGLRLDTLLAPYRYADMSALETVVFFSGTIRLQQHLFLRARAGFDDNRVGNGERNRTGFVNPSLGLTAAFPIGSLFRFAAATTVGLPLATGGGNASDVDAIFLHRQGALARSAIDNNAFAANDLGFPTGLSVAFVHRGFTVQVDGTIIPSGRVKGTGTEGDGAKVNSTFGLFMGYFVIPELSLGAEVHYQYYLLPPSIVDKDPSARDNLSAGAGARIDIELSETSRVRPGLCFSMGLSGYVEQQAFRMVQFDLPFSF